MRIPHEQAYLSASDHRLSNWDMENRQDSSRSLFQINSFIYFPIKNFAKFIILHFITRMPAVINLPSSEAISNLSNHLRPLQFSTSNFSSPLFLNLLTSFLAHSICSVFFSRSDDSFYLAKPARHRSRSGEAGGSAG